MDKRTRRQRCDVTLARLRHQVQRCVSHMRLGLAAVGEAEEQLLRCGHALSIEQFSEIMHSLAQVRALLEASQGEVRNDDPV